MYSAIHNNHNTKDTYTDIVDNLEIIVTQTIIHGNIDTLTPFKQFGDRFDVKSKSEQIECTKLS